MWQARWKLVSLWFSQTARVMADNALRFFVCIDYAARGDAEQKTAWLIVTVIFTTPAILLAPFNGALSNSLPKSRVLIWSALLGLIVMTVFALLEGQWLSCWALIAIGSAVYGPTRYAMLPAAAADTKWPLTRINGFIEMGTFTAILGGLVLIAGTKPDAPSELPPWTTAIIWGLVSLYCLALFTALPVGFPSDVRRDDAPWPAVRGFFADCAAIWRVREARICLIGLAGKRGLIIGMSNAMLALLFGGNRFNLSEMAVIVSWVAGGVALGSLLAGLQKHPRRVLALVPFGGIGFTLGMAYAAGGEDPNLWFCALVGMTAGVINVPLAATYQAALPADARGNGMSVRNMTDYIFAMVVALGMIVLTHFAALTPAQQLWIIASVSGCATVGAWWVFRREVAEQLLEFAFAIMFRFRSAGPGLEKFPLKGPVIVVANHSCYMDPLLLGKVLPRSLIPMMTSVFFDHWFLRWTMTYLADAIRVEKSGFRRDVPELRVAIAALDAGKCLVIFPEGRLRRSEEQPLKMFGQGVWHILKERPQTPVVVCWIEGGWGSYFSYFKGPPTKGKKFDIAHPIGIAVGEPHLLGEELLADQRATRQYLMEQCLAARQHLGLAPFVAPQVEAETREEE
ncbi:MAG: MFS transporter [Gemmataceae bacterium]|nr:MFS transporter [Gemmataceae bacterium]